MFVRISLMMSALLLVFISVGCGNGGENNNNNNTNTQGRNLGCNSVASTTKETFSEADLEKLSKMTDAEFQKTELTVMGACTLSYGEIKDATGKALSKLPLQEDFSMVLKLTGEGCDKYEIKLAEDTLSVGKKTGAATAIMPCHGHGMPTGPVLTKQSDGSYLLEGMKFSMPEWWRFYLDVTDGTNTERAIFNIYVDF
ncbi:MAG: hypothetical protein CL920_17445 [Deltaproteobacteria bacterium]|nr:hypothetical protein [Deltaproteobacteria bacterium]|tara:strand:- start:456 stop:1049 length:594 start_codon:yes stop_codon:yes gene_type:complete